MKRVCLAGVGVFALLALARQAAGADLSRRYEPVVPKAPVYAPLYNWTGFYLGLNGGVGWGHSAWDSTGSFDPSGGLAGGTIGYNWQTGGWVFGLEGDLDWSDIDGRTTVFCPLGCRTRNSWLATVRGRVGYAFDRIMPYVTGGLALGGIKASTPGLPGKSETEAGWTAGAGLEVAIAGTWTAKAEYLFVDLGDLNCGPACGGGLVKDNVSFHSHILRGGINYRF